MKPLSPSCTDEYQLRLLHSAASEAPDPESLPRLLERLEEENALVRQATAYQLSRPYPLGDVRRLELEEPIPFRPQARVARVPRWWSSPAWMAAGVVLGAFGGAAVTARMLAPTENTARLEPEPTTVSSAAPRTPLAAESARPGSAADTVRSAESATRSRPRLPVVRSSSAPPARVANELELVDGARKAVEKGDSEGALRALDEHERNYQQGPLAHEARVLRIQALIKAGRHRDAELAAHGFLATYVDSPYEGRVRALLAEAERLRAATDSALDAGRDTSEVSNAKTR